MQQLLRVLLLSGALQLGTVSGYSAESAKTYQVTGPVVELNEKTIVVQKGDERWEIARDEKNLPGGAP